jgi:hypothetical protein
MEHAPPCHSVSCCVTLGQVKPPLPLLLLCAMRCAKVVQDKPRQQFPHSPLHRLPLLPNWVDVLRAALAHETVSEEPWPSRVLLSFWGEQKTNKDEQKANTTQEGDAVCECELETHEGEQEANNYGRVKAGLTTHPQTADRAVADGLASSISIANT